MANMPVRVTPDPILGKMPDGPLILPNAYLPSGDINPAAVSFYRHAHGLTQEMFAEIIGGSQRQVSLWENGRTRPSKEAHVRIYQFVQATAMLMQKYGGIIPANLQAGQVFLEGEGTDALTALIQAVEDTAERTAELGRQQAMHKEQALELLALVSEQLATAHRMVENAIRRVKREW